SERVVGRRYASPDPGRIAPDVGLVEANEPHVIVADSRDISISGAWLDDVLELVSEDCLLIDQPRQRRKYDIQRKIARTANDVRNDRAVKVQIRRLILAVVSLLTHETRNNIDDATYKSADHMHRYATDVHIM